MKKNNTNMKYERLFYNFVLITLFIFFSGCSVKYNGDKIYDSIYNSYKFEDFAFFTFKDQISSSYLKIYCFIKQYTQESLKITNVHMFDADTSEPLFIRCTSCKCKIPSSSYVFYLSVPQKSISDQTTTETKNILIQFERKNGQKEETKLQVVFGAHDKIKIIKTNLLSTEGFRKDFLGYTYPLWGLPRDFIDVPFTFFNNTRYGNYGFINEMYSIKSKTIIYPPTIKDKDFKGDEIRACTPFQSKILFKGSIVVCTIKSWYMSGFPITIRSMFSLKPFVYISIGSLAGVVVGLFMAEISEDIYGFLINPLQTILLRTGADNKLLKDFDDKILRREAEKTKRSFAYFPNWQFIAKKAPFEEKIVWKIVNIKKMN